jgi:hypothetical protein
MMEKNFDKILKDKLTGHDSQVPSDMWSRIEQDLVKRKPRPILPWVLSTVVLVSVVLYYSINRLQEGQGSSAKTEHVLEKNRENATHDYSPVKSENHSKSLVNTDDENIILKSGEINANSDADEGALATRADQATNSSSQGQGTITPAQSRLGQNFKSERKIDQSASIPNNANTSNANKTVENKSEQFSQSDQSNLSLKSKSDLRNIGDESAEKQRKTNNNHQNYNGIPSKNDQSAQVAISLDDQAETGDVMSSEQLAEMAAMRKAMLVEPLLSQGFGQSLAIGHFVYDPCSVKGGKKKNRVHCYSFVTQNTLVFADFMAGPQYSHKLLTARNIQDPNPTKLLNNRKETESYMFSYNATARLGIKLPSGLTGSAGLSFDRFHERFDYYDPSHSRPTITYVIRDTFILKDVNNMDSTVYELQTISIQAQGKRTVKHTNTMTFISIPLTAGYTWQMNKFNVGINGGVAVNLLFGKAGRITDPDGTVSSLNGSGSDDEFKARAGIGLIGGLTFEYKLKRGLSFIAEPQFKYQLSNLTVNDYGLEQRYLNAGINIGLRKILRETTSSKKKYGVN